MNRSVYGNGLNSYKAAGGGVSFTRLAAAALCVLLLAVVAQARVHRSQAWAETQFAKAEAQCQTLHGRHEQSRTKREYQAVIASYRRVYFGAPTSSKAEGSVFLVAELTAEMGRQFKDPMALYAAVREYKFLRREYPGSKHRIEALLAIGEIYKNDIGDQNEARAAFQEFIQRYPHSELTKQAQADLVGLDEVEDTDAKQASAPRSAPATDAAPVVDSKPTDAAAAPESASDSSVKVKNVEYWSKPDSTRVAVYLEQGVQFEPERLDNPDRIYFDLKDTEIASHLAGQSIDVKDGLVNQIRTAQYKPGLVRVVIETEKPADYSASMASNPPRLLIDVKNASKPDAPSDGKVVAAAERAPEKSVEPPPSAPGFKKVVVEADDDDSPSPAADAGSSLRVKESSRSASKARGGKNKVASAPPLREARPTSDGDRSLIRALGLKIGKIVIDPGHGGHDTGTIGPHGLLEKDLVLDVSKRLGKLLETRLGAEVVFTRRDDTFIPLEERTAIANKEKADLFVSVHANSSHDPDARGVETYYLNFTSSAEALEVAARENAASDKSIHELQDLVKTIALKEKIEESREFASDVQESLHKGLAGKGAGLRDRGVKKAPFVVLIGANMPSILAEISFLSNPGDEKRLKTPAYRQKIAESLYRGISRYVNGLGGVKVASQLDKTSAN